MICGAHESVAGGLFKAFERAEIDGCKAIQIFTKNSNTWRESTLTDEQIEAFRKAHAAYSEKVGAPVHVLAHTSYLINLAADKPDTLEKSRDALVAEVKRSSDLGVSYVVLHPGAHLGLGEDAGLDRVAESLTEVLERTSAMGATSARIVIENTAGQGTCVGHTFAHLGAIFERVKESARLGICFDTQHAFASGYNLSTAS